MLVRQSVTIPQFESLLAYAERKMARGEFDAHLGRAVDVLVSAAQEFYATDDQEFEKLRVRFEAAWAVATDRPPEFCDPQSSR